MSVRDDDKSICLASDSSSSFGADEWAEVGQTSVDWWLVSTTTRSTPWCYSDEIPTVRCVGTANKRTTRVTVASSDTATDSTPNTDMYIWVVVSTPFGLASSVIDDWNLSFLELVWKRAGSAGTSPASDEASLWDTVNTSINSTGNSYNGWSIDWYASSNNLNVNKHKITIQL